MNAEILEILKRLETKIDEHTLILRALEHSAEVNKDLSKVELVTANNWADIVKLKAIK